MAKFRRKAGRAWALGAASPFLTLPTCAFLGPAWLLLAWAITTFFWFRAMRLDAIADPARSRHTYRILTFVAAVLAALGWSLIMGLAIGLVAVPVISLFERN
jgi:hypothetical protein